MSERENRCGIIASGIENLKREWQQENDRVFDLEASARDLNDDLRNAEFELSALSVAAIPTRIGRDPVTIAAAIALQNQISRAESRIADLRQQLRRIVDAKKRAERKRDDKLALIRQLQDAFNGNDCFSLGFSHNALNPP